MTLGMAAIALMNIMWLQAAPTAFKNIGWKFYLAFIIPGYLFAIVAYFYYPETRGLPLEEIAALFGDEEVVGQREIEREIAMGGEAGGEKGDVSVEEGERQSEKS